MLKHHSPAKSGHSKKNKIKKNNCGTCALSVLFVTQAIGVHVQVYIYCTRWRLSLINRYTWIIYYKKRSVGISLYKRVYTDGGVT